MVIWLRPILSLVVNASRQRRISHGIVILHGHRSPIKRCQNRRGRSLVHAPRCLFTAVAADSRTESRGKGRISGGDGIPYHGGRNGKPSGAVRLVDKGIDRTAPSSVGTNLIYGINTLNGYTTRCRNIPVIDKNTVSRLAIIVYIPQYSSLMDCPGDAAALDLHRIITTLYGSP